MFENGASIDEQFTCKGADKSPQLKWSGVPSATRALALIVDDPDAPHGTFVHWVVYNLPPGAQGLPEGVPKGERLSGGGSQGANGFGKIGYNGPCPPPGKLHHYHFRLFALDQEVNPGPTPDASALENAMTGHVKASAEVVATFTR